MSKLHDIKTKVSDYFTKSRTERHFSKFYTDRSSSTNIAAAKSMVSNATGYINELSEFQDMRDEDVYENIYSWDAATGSAIDKFSSLVRQSIVGVVLKDVGESLDEREKLTLKLAKEIYDVIEAPDLFESWSELLMMQGNVFIVPDETDWTITVLPNKYCALIDSLELLGTSFAGVMMQPNYLAFNEFDFDELASKVYSKGEFIHIKYKNTPIFITDVMGRKSFGFYSLSPLNRSVLSVWWSRIIQMMDIMLRWKNVPREHWQVSSDMFNPEFYSGTPDTRRTSAKSDADAFISTFIRNMQNQMPDQGYVTTDAVKGSILESRVNYLSANELLKQLETISMLSVNMPRSAVDGSNAGSYASELIISNYLSSKVVEIAAKLKPTILMLIRERVRLIDSSLPVEKIDIKIDLSLASSMLELWRIIQLMVASGLYTEQEIRAVTGYEPLTKEQKENVVVSNPAQTYLNTALQNTRDVMNGGSSQSPQMPMTEHAREDTRKEEGLNTIRNAERV